MPHPARLDVPAPTLRAVTGWVAAARRGPGARPRRRAATACRQVVLVLRWLRHRADAGCLAADAGVWIATAYRYLHQGLDVIADRAPTLEEVLERAHADGLAYLCLDGTLVPTDRVAGATPRGNDTCYSGKNRRFGGNVQVIADPSGFPLGVPPACGGGTSAVRPGSWHDLRCARELALPHLYPHTAPSRPDRIPVLADKGYIGAGTGIHVPIRRPRDGQTLHQDNRTYNHLLTALRAPAERAHALLQGWRALLHVTLDPSRIIITTITAAALVLTSLQRGRK